MGEWPVIHILTTSSILYPSPNCWFYPLITYLIDFTCFHPPEGSCLVFLWGTPPPCPTLRLSSFRILSLSATPWVAQKLQISFFLKGLEIEGQTPACWVQCPLLDYRLPCSCVVLCSTVQVSLCDFERTPNYETITILVNYPVHLLKSPLLQHPNDLPQTLTSDNTTLRQDVEFQNMTFWGWLDIQSIIVGQLF